MLVVSLTFYLKWPTLEGKVIIYTCSLQFEPTTSALSSQCFTCWTTAALLLRQIVFKKFRLQVLRISSSRASCWCDVTIWRLHHRQETARKDIGGEVEKESGVAEPGEQGRDDTVGGVQTPHRKSGLRSEMNTMDGLEDLQYFPNFYNLLKSLSSGRAEGGCPTVTIVAFPAHYSTNRALLIMENQVTHLYDKYIFDVA